MKKSQPLDQDLSRRRFLFRGACASLGVTSIVNTLAHLRLIQSAVAQSTLTDYKAMVCIFLYGGNDSNNMLLPGNGAARANYDLARPFGHPLHLASASTLALTAPGIFGTPNATAFGLHPSMSNARALFNSGNLAFIANAGTLVEPVADNADYTSGLKSLPPQLFSHSDQQLQWQSSIPDRPFQSGWGGRVADLLNPGYNPDSKVSMNISISGQNNFQVGRVVVPYSVGTGGVVSLAGYGTNYSGAATYDPPNPPVYLNNDAGRTLKGLDRITELVHEHLLEEGYNRVMRNARDKELQVGGALGLSGTGTAAGTAIDNAFNTAFAGATLPDIAAQLKTVARLINGRASLENTRQIFFVSMGGFDTHQEQPADHIALLANLDKALQGFRDAITAITDSGASTPFSWDDVVAFTHSDFTRTLQPNGSQDSSGTDHGWGGHQIVMGGPVIGQKIYGQFPDLQRGTATGLDVDSNRGRWIPTTSVEQYASVIAKWFGVTNAQIDGIFPNLYRFQNTAAIPSSLEFLDPSV